MPTTLPAHSRFAPMSAARVTATVAALVADAAAEDAARRARNVARLAQLELDAARSVSAAALATWLATA